MSKVTFYEALALVEATHQTYATFQVGDDGMVEVFSLYWHSDDEGASPWAWYVGGRLWDSIGTEDSYDPEEIDDWAKEAMWRLAPDDFNTEEMLGYQLQKLGVPVPPRS